MDFLAIISLVVDIYSLVVEAIGAAMASPDFETRWSKVEADLVKLGVPFLTETATEQTAATATIHDDNKPSVTKNADGSVSLSEGE